MANTERGASSDNCELSSYEELAGILAHLPVLVREHRRQTRQSLRAAGTALDMSAATIDRLEKGQGKCGLASAERLLRWIGTSPSAPPAP